MPNLAYDKRIVYIVTETTTPAHSSLYPRNKHSIKFPVNMELRYPCPTMIVQKIIYQDGKFGLSAQSGVEPFTKNTVKLSSHHDKHPNEHLETSVQDTRLRKTKLSSHIPLNVANMMKYSQKGSRHLEVSQYNT